MRLKLYEDAIKAKAQKKASRRNSRRSPTPQDEPTDADAEVEAPGEEPEGGGDLASLAAAMSRESPSDTSRSSKHGKSSKPSVTSRASHGPKDLPKGDDLDELSASATQARTEMVQKVLEGLREEAFELARDIGVDVLTQPGGLRKFVKKLRDVVFPRASEEARELFKAGQKPGSLARQNGESMLSYVSRRRRWWKLLKTLDGSIELSEPMRVERNSGNLQSKSSRPSGYRPKGIRVRPTGLTLLMPGTKRILSTRRIRSRRRTFMKPLTKSLMKIPRQGTPKTQKVMVKSMRTTSYPSPKQ